MTDYNVSLKVRLLLLSGRNILLLKQTKPNGGNYTLVGGGIEKEEYAKKALIRESREEAGIELEDYDLELVHVLHKRKKEDHRITLYFVAKQWTGVVRSLEKNKFSSVQWFPLYDLPEKLTGTVKHVLTQYKKGNYYSEFYKK